MFRSLRHFARRVGLSGFAREMSNLKIVQRLNPINNKMEWKLMNEEYDYYQEIATSCYGDMLHDDERNKKFGEALKKAIKKVQASGRKAHVLDIGTGTGLLSMLAVQYGADSVVACEAFLPMANCALEILKENNFSDKVKVVQCHSTALTVGQEGDLKQRANILVSEVFDTELIGEGAIRTFNHALEHLLEEDCIVIPSSGTVYAQVVESDLAVKWNRLEDWRSGEELLVKVPEEIKSCPGAGAVHDIQLSEFHQKHFKVLSEVIPVFKFYWAKNEKIPTHRQQKSVTKAVSSGKAQVVFMWWDLNMDEEGEIVISCAPVWEHPSAKDRNVEDIKSLTKSLPWRDHWMQAVYFLRHEAALRENEAFALWSNHDEFSFWFEVEGPSGERAEVQRPVCECAFHFLLSRTRIGAMNDDRRRKSFLQSLKKTIGSDTVCVTMSDTPLLNMLCAVLGARKVLVVGEPSPAQKVCSMLAEENGLKEAVSLLASTDHVVEDVAKGIGEDPCEVLVVSEPYFRNSILPWHNLQFDNLWKIARPLNACEGFSMRVFDDLIATAKANTENYVEAQPLWEYPGVALTGPATLFEFELGGRLPGGAVGRKGEVGFGWGGRCDGVAVWMEYGVGGEGEEEGWLSFGAVGEVRAGEYVEWDMYERQGVHLFREGREVRSGEAMFYEAEFDPRELQFKLNFGLESDGRKSEE